MSDFLPVSWYIAHNYCIGTTTFPASEMIAVVRVDASSVDSVMSEFELLSGENETTIFNGKVPTSTPIKLSLGIRLYSGGEE